MLFNCVDLNLQIRRRLRSAAVVTSVSLRRYPVLEDTSLLNCAPGSQPNKPFDSHSARGPAYKNAIVRISTLSRVGASGGDVGSLNAE